MSNLVNVGPIESATDFTDDAAGWAERWDVELKAAQKEFEKYQKAGNRIVRTFLDKRDASGDQSALAGNISKINLFSSNVQIMRSILYGKTPQVSVDRKWSDTNDDVARVAGVIMERLLNADVETPGDGYAEALQQLLDDRLIVGLGCARIRYEAKFESQDMPPIMGDGPMDEAGMPTQIEIAPGYVRETKTDEMVPTDYVNWRDILWSPARTWSEVRWLGFRALMTKDAGIERFGEDFEQVPQQHTPRQGVDGRDGVLESKDPWKRTEVWEIWDRESGKVYWHVIGYSEILDIKADPLGLPDFFPMPRPFIANATTTQLMPTPDYTLAQDIYTRIDTLETRIDWLVKACKLVGVYDASSVGIGRMFNEASETELIPVDNWAMFAEKGGIKGQLDWLPIEQVANTISVLVGQRDSKIQLLYQVTGMSDIMRGQSEGGATATEQSIKARFASVRVQALQDEFAKFATDLQALKAHVIVTQFDDAKIIEASNIMQTDDGQLAPQAVQLLRSQLASYRVIVRPEALAATDYGAMQAERTAALSSVSQFLTAAQPIVQSNPAFGPYLMEMLKWTFGAFKGAATIEGTLDRMIEDMKQQAQQAQAPQAPPQPDPTEVVKAEAEQTKAQASTIVANTDLKKAQVEAAATAAEQNFVREAGLNAPAFGGPPQ